LGKITIFSTLDSSKRMLTDKINTLEDQLQAYMNDFCNLVNQSMNAEKKSIDMSNVTASLKESHKKMVEIVQDMKFLDESEESLYKKVQAYESQNNKSIHLMNSIDSQIERIAGEVENSLTEISRHSS